jgi:hypothetical protein
MAEHAAERGPLHPQRRCSWSELFVNLVHVFAFHKNLPLPQVPVAPLVPLLCLLRLAADPQPDPGDENNTCFKRLLKLSGGEGEGDAAWC